MSWQLANEPRPGPDGPEAESNLPVFNRWIDETASFIHGLDTNHLVSTGSEGTIGFAFQAEPYVQAHQFKSIDYVTCHVWPKNWGWFDPLKFEETLPSSESKALAYIQEHCLLARRLGKPLVMEEFGLARDSAACLPGSPTTARDRYFAKSIFRRLRLGSCRIFAGGNELLDVGRRGESHASGLYLAARGFRSLAIRRRSHKATTLSFTLIQPRFASSVSMRTR